MAVHVVLLPWTSQGHMTPMMQLGLVLASQPDFHTTLVLTSRTHARLQASSSPLLHHPNLPIQVINDGLNPDPSYSPPFQDILNSLPTLQHNLHSLLQLLMASPSPVTCLISGTFCGWSQSVARELNIPRVELWSSPASIYCVCFYHHLLLSSGIIPLKGDKENVWITCIPGVPPIRASDFVKELLITEEEAQADTESFQRICNVVKDTYGNARDQYRILVNTIYDLDSQALDALCSDGVAARAIGPLFLHTSNKAITQQNTILYREDRSCLQWLDGRENASTLYIAFGSEARMTKSEVQELAYGLEASGQSFLWVIRPGSIADESSMDGVLPEGYEGRVMERGKIVSWAPQIEVLAHPSIGGFMSHCGWNSTLETLWLGVPILAWPQRADQGINKMFIVEEWKVGIAIKKQEGKVTRSSIEEAIRALMQEEEGTHIREKVKEAKGVLCKAIQKGGSSRNNLDQFICDLRHLSDNKDKDKV